MTGRSTVLGAIRDRLGVSETDATRQLTVDSRISAHADNTRPVKSQLTGVERIEWFSERAASRGTTIHRAADRESLTELLATEIGGSPHCTPAVAELNLPIEFETWSLKSSVESCVSTCFCGIAETGTLVIKGDGKNPTSEIFLADQHIVLLCENDVLDSMESVWTKVRETNTLPRHLTMVSGASSTGDIEMKMEQGVHGPRELVIILLGFEI